MTLSIVKNVMTLRTGTIALAIVLGGSAPGPALAVEPDAPDRLLVFDETIGIAVRNRLGGGERRLSKREKAERAGLASFYQARGNLPLFVSRSGLNARAVSAMAEIRKAGDWALPAGAFALPDLPAADASGAPLSRQDLAAAELKLGLAVQKYARYASGGRTDPLAISSFLDRAPPLPEPVDVMERLAKAPAVGAALRAFHPRHPQFEELLRGYKAMLSGKTKEAQSELPRLKEGPSLKKGMKNAQVAILRQRLGVNTPIHLDARHFDDNLYKAVRAFQKKAGLTVDGVVGPASRASLNGEDAKGSPEKLLVNLEQWRWMPRDLGDLHIWVNIPEFKVRVVKNGKIIHTERVVVGKPHNQTPIFSENLKWVEFHPSWYVPTSIKVKEIAPGIRRSGTRFLERQNLKVSCPDGAYIRPKPSGGLFNFGQPKPRPRVDIRNCRVVQPPGPKNVLGVVKFKLPNKHDVYLHDTSSKSLFNRSKRAFSHGCVRVRDPLKLAQIILGHDQGITRSRIDSIVNGPRQTLQTYLKSKVPVHFTYFTAIGDDAGKLRYSNDLYGHEKRIALGLAGKYNQIEPVRKSSPLPPSPRVSAPAPAGNKNSNWLKKIFGGF